MTTVLFFKCEQNGRGAGKSGRIPSIKGQPQRSPTLQEPVHRNGSRVHFSSSSLASPTRGMKTAAVCNGMNLAMPFGLKVIPETALQGHFLTHLTSVPTPLCEVWLLTLLMPFSEPPFLACFTFQWVGRQHKGEAEWVAQMVIWSWGYL